MKILVSNDDGIFAPGVEALVNVLGHLGEVCVVCPDREQSAVSHSITLSYPIKATPLNIFPNNVSAWAVNGTPADCVKMGIEVLMKEKPDLVFSGINLGPNIGRDVFYSGTIASAVEAVLCDIPAVSLSLAAFDGRSVNYQNVQQLVYEICEIIARSTIPKGVFLNVNFPYTTRECCRGVKVAPLDLSVSRYQYVGMNDPYGNVYYWLKDDYQQLDELTKGSDFIHLKDGYVTITPVQWKQNGKRNLNQIEQWFREFNSSREAFIHENR
ncbi:5'/3'-nucleotidase SurE [Sporolactobacillus shoreicorticis]|uniref:5'-nucleotidase SurE n=1 Tax=Sporolactobacillus shoreicorticis TaxID=1923877 RepID=A0ABW5S3S7_9BACL|nr:5'/3'-nucleotidase SurE [Sporolactobacillus shoreicorticis]MCO7124417.1 5'/3'-nucleotidase SurE [Sporolactobacillus shoreicorticis]